MKYQITTQTKERYWITEDEAKNIAKGEMKGLVFVPSVKGYINLSFVVSVIPENLVQNDHTEGRLHDGTKVIKRFGQWVDAHNPDVNLDHGHYPELGTGEVMSEEDYQNKQSSVVV